MSHLVADHEALAVEQRDHLRGAWSAADNDGGLALSLTSSRRVITARNLDGGYKPWTTLARAPGEPNVLSEPKP